VISKQILLGFWFVCLLSSTRLLGRPAKDTVYFKNGDKWTCEIKKLEKGYLFVKLDYVDGDVQVDWTKVSSIQTEQLFVVRDRSGNLYVSPLHTEAKQDGPFELENSGAKTELARDTIVALDQTERSFWQDLHGGISVGFSFTKGDDQTQYNLNANALYLKKLWTAGVQLQSSFNGSLSAPSNQRNSLSSYVIRVLDSRNYFVAGLADFLHSDEQQLQLRSAIGGAGGKILINSERTRLMTFGGLVWTREQYFPDPNSPSSPYLNSAEAVVGARMEYFRFKTTNFAANAMLYPSLSDPGRVRLDSSGAIKYELIKNLYINFGLYLNYDSRPPRATTKTDYGANSSIGFTF
jgi:hypothetical protein